MLKIAEKFKALDRSPRKQRASSSIFGSTNLGQAITEKQKPTISLYPIIDTDEPEVAMGIASCLCYILEQYEKVRVYRVFAKFIEEDNSDDINTDDFQFHVNQWEFEGLDDNVIIQGSITKVNNVIILEFDIDTSLFMGEVSDKQLRYEYPSYVSIANDLPKIAQDILKDIISIDETKLIITYDDVKLLPEDTGKVTLTNVFYWNLDLYLYMWESDWEEDDIISQFDDMIALYKSSGGEFVLWCSLMMAKQVMTIDLAMIGEVIIPSINELLSDGIDMPTNAHVIFSQGLLKLGYLTQAIDTLSAVKENSPSERAVWLTLVELYISSSDIVSAVDIAQEGLENVSDDIQLLWYYVQLLTMISDRELTLESVLYVDPDEFKESEHIVQEIIQVLYEILSINRDAYFAICELLDYLIRTNDLDTPSWLNSFLSHPRSTPEEVRTIIDKFYEYEHMDQIIGVFENYADSHKEDSWAHIYLAQLHILMADNDSAARSLELATEYNTDNNPDIVVEIQKLSLDAEIEGFEYEYSNIIVMLNANKAVSENAVDLLESATGIAPLLADLHVTLARCYQSWNDVESALEVLSEVDSTINNHPDILLLKAEIFWGQGKSDDAFEVLNSILHSNPNNINALAKLAELLIANNQLDDSRVYIERAETLAPSHPRVWQLRKMVADKLG